MAKLFYSSALIFFVFFTSRPVFSGDALTLSAEVSTLKKEVQMLKAENQALRKENAKLKAALNLQQRPALTNTTNSKLPVRPTQ